VDDWVLVGVAGSEAEAELLCSVLRGAGIECLPRLTNSGAGAGDGLGTVGAHDILVSPQDAQDAREILHNPQMSHSQSQLDRTKRRPYTASARLLLEDRRKRPCLPDEGTGARVGRLQRTEDSTMVSFCGKPTPRQRAARQPRSAKSPREQPLSRVVVQAVAGSSPVAHPQRQCAVWRRFPGGRRAKTHQHTHP
jgi:hypothetical protein